MKVISNSFIPNTEKDDFLLSLKTFFKPFLWQKGKSIKKLEEEFKKKFSFRYCFSFNSGRSALLACLKAIDLNPGEEVFLQAFSCNAVLNPILFLRAKPIFVDIDKNLNLDPKDLEKKIPLAKKPKAIIVQHTFGWPAQIEKIKEIAKKEGLFLIEDCAHSLGGKYKNEYLGKFGDLSFFSFGRDKVISSIFGGIAATNSKELAEKISSFQKGLDFPSKHWIGQTLFQRIIFFSSLPFYNFFALGKTVLYLARKLKLIAPAVYPSEKKGKLAKAFPKKMPNALCCLALNQLKKVKRFNCHRRKMARFYLERTRSKGIKVVFDDEKNYSQAVFLRFPILVKKRKKIIEKLKRKGIYLEDAWSEAVVVPKDSSLEKFFYQKGSCPKAEKIVKEIVNLPTNIRVSQKEAQRILSEIFKFYLMPQQTLKREDEAIGVERGIPDETGRQQKRGGF